MAYDLPANDSDGGSGKEIAPRAAGMQTLRCRTVARGTIWQETYILDFPPRSTAAEREGLSLSADDLASTPMEDLLGALGACLTRSLHANALAGDIPVRSIEMTAVGDMHRPGRWGSIGAPAPVGFETIQVSVQIDSDAPRAVLADLLKATALWSPVANTLFNQVHLDVRLVEDVRAAAGGEDPSKDGLQRPPSE